MAAGATYEPIATTTLSTAASTITFSSISAAYTDLRLVVTFLKATSGTTGARLTYNGSATTYSDTILYGDGASASSTISTGATYIDFTAYSDASTTIPALVTADIFSYAGSTFKTCLITASADKNGSGYVERIVGLWRNTSAITSLTVTASSGSFAIGTTATLYGILRA